MSLHRLVGVTVGVPDVAAASGFYRDFGLDERAPGRFATTYGGEQLRLVTAPRRTLAEIVVGADSPDDLAAIAAALRGLGIDAERRDGAVVTRDPAAGVAVRIEVSPRLDPPAEPATPFNGPGRSERRGRAPGLVSDAPARPRKLGHVVYGSLDAQVSRRFYVDGLGFKVSDTIGPVAAFLRCSTDHHNVLVQQAPVAFLHHTAWELGDVDEIGRGARALLAVDPGRHTWGFGRHHVGSNFFWYFRDPAGNFCEYYSDLDVIPADEVWTPEDFADARALASWGPPPPPSFLAPDDLAALMAG
jgi:catechol 2,3-dioxygenase-like lactoylglutathione lyase family enzyme